MKGRPLPRRDFLKKASAAGFGAIAMSRGFGPLFAFDGSPVEKMTVGVMGLNGRGTVLAHGFARNANATVAYLCDVDSNVLAKAVPAIAQDQATSPKAVGDFRRVLEDKNVDAIAIASPYHWPTPATILALHPRNAVSAQKPSGQQ